MNRESANSSSSSASGGYTGPFSSLGSGRASGSGPFLSFRGFGSSREKKTPLPRDDPDDAPAPPSPEQISYQAVATTGQPDVADTAVSFSSNHIPCCHAEDEPLNHFGTRFQFYINFSMKTSDCSI